MGIYFSADKRFRRAQVRPTRRRRSKEAGRRFVRSLILLSLVGGFAYLAPSLLLQSSIMRIDTISVEGNHFLSIGEVLSLVDELHGDNILTADLETNRDQLLTSGWVKTATLRRLLPSTIEVAIEERKPVGLGRFASRLYLIDSGGMVIDEYGPGFADLALPIIDGLAPPGSLSIVVDDVRANLAARVIATLGTKTVLAERVSQIDVSDPYNAVVLLSDDPTFLYLGSEQFAERLHRYLELAPALRSRVPEIDYVDMRFERRVYVGPTGLNEELPQRSLLAAASIEGVGREQ